MNYKSISSTPGGKANQWCGDQPLQGPQSNTAEAAAPNRSGPSGGANQWGNGGPYAKSAGIPGKHRSI